MKWRENEVAGEKEIQFLWRRLKWSEDSSLMWEWSEETGFYSKKLTFFYSYTTLYIHGHGQSYIHFTTLQCTPHCTPQSLLHLAAQGRAPLHTPLHLIAHTTAPPCTHHCTSLHNAEHLHLTFEKKKKKKRSGMTKNSCNSAVEIRWKSGEKLLPKIFRLKSG